MKKFFLLTTVACVLSMNANAGEMMNMMHDMRPYVGLDYIYSDVDMDEATDGTTFKHKFNNASMNVGVKVNEYMGLEAFYQMSMVEDKNLTDQRNKSKFYAYGADVMGYMPVYEGLEVIGGLGLGQYEFKRTSLGAIYDKNSDSGIGVRMGAGLQYNLTENVALRAMGRYTWLDVDHANHLTEFTVGARYTF